MQQVRRGRNIQSLFLLLFCLNETFYSNESIKVTPQRTQNCAVEILNPEFWPSKTPCLQGSDSWKKLHRGSMHWVWKETFPGSFLYSLLEAYQNNLAVHILLYSPSKHRTRSAHFPSFSESSGWGKSQNGPNFLFSITHLSSTGWRGEGVWQPTLCGGKYLLIWQNHRPKMSFPPLKWKVLHVCVRPRAKQRKKL